MARTLSVVDVVFRGRTAQFTRSLNRAETRTSAFARRAKLALKAVAAASAAAGGALTALGAKAVKAAAEFESGMTKVNTLVGLSRERVRGMRDDVLRMAQETGQAPDELTEALFRLTSGGIRGAKVLESLRQAARASAVGMGEVGELARVATGAVEAFKNQGLTLSGAMDTMLATVREGNVKIKQFGGSLENVAKQAAQAGISFQELGAFLATASRTIPTRKAARGLSQFLINIRKETDTIQEAFKDAGTSLEEFRAAIREDGLFQALVDLERAAEANNVAMERMIGRSNAIRGITAVLGDTTQDYRKILESVIESQGITNDAFEATRQTLKNLIDRVKATWQTFKITLGEQLAPLARNLLNAFQRNMPQIGSMVASGLANVLRVVATTVDFFHNAVPEIGIGGLVGFLFLGPKGAAIGGLIGKVIAENSLRLKRAINDLLPGEPFEFNPLEKTLLRARKLQAAMDKVREKMSQTSDPSELRRLNARMNQLQQRIEQLKDRAQELAEQGFEGPANRAHDAWDRFTDQLRETADQLDRMRFGAGGGGGAGSTTPSDLGITGEMFGTRTVDTLARSVQQAVGTTTALQEAGRAVGMELAKSAFGALTEGLPRGFDRSQAIQNIADASRDIGQDVGDKMTDSMSRIMERGAQSAMRRLLEGLIKGRDNIIQSVINVGLDIASAIATQGLMKGLDIGSPSRVGVRIGEALGQGLVVGMGNMMGAVNRQSLAMAGAATPSFGSVRGPSVSRGRVPRRATPAGGGQPVHIHEGDTEVKVSAMDSESFVRFAERNRGVFGAMSAKAASESRGIRHKLLAGR